MTIDKSGSWWTGEATDLDEYLVEFAASRQTPVQRVGHAACASCGAETFSVALDDDEGFAQRTCVGCQTVWTMLDGSDIETDASPEDAACPCGNETFQVACGFSLLESGEVQWVYVALRCTRDGVLGVYTDWKFDYEPSTQLFEQV